MGAHGVAGAQGMEGAQGVQMSMEELMREKMDFWASLMESTSGVTRHREGRVNCTNGTYQDINKQINVLFKILFLWRQPYCKVEISMGQINYE